MTGPLPDLDIYTAAELGNVEDVRYFIEEKKVAVTQYSNGRTALHLAAWKNPRLDVLNLLIAQGANVNALNHANQTPLHLAAAGNPNPDILKYLIIQGADIHAKADDGSTPLHLASERNPNAAVLKLLIDQGVDVNAKADDGATALDNAGTEEKQKILRDAGGKATWR